MTYRAELLSEFIRDQSLLNFFQYKLLFQFLEEAPD